jgi:hypothetical protein
MLGCATFVLKVLFILLVTVASFCCKHRFVRTGTALVLVIAAHTDIMPSRSAHGGISASSRCLGHTAGWFSCFLADNDSVP